MRVAVENTQLRRSAQGRLTRSAVLARQWPADILIMPLPVKQPGRVGPRP